jgi:hypothetical protein
MPVRRWPEMPARRLLVMPVLKRHLMPARKWLRMQAKKLLVMPARR